MDAGCPPAGCLYVEISVHHQDRKDARSFREGFSNYAGASGSGASHSEAIQTFNDYDEPCRWVTRYDKSQVFIFVRIY